MSSCQTIVSRNMFSSVKLPFHFDPDLLQRDLQSILESDFVPHFNRPYYEGNWSAVPLRSVGGSTSHIFFDHAKANQIADTPFLEKCSYVQSVLRSFDCPLSIVRFLRLTPGSVVKEHRDYGLGWDEGEARLHIPILTNSNVIFCLDGKRIIMKPGECWYNDFGLKHSVRNEGTTDRVHLVIDCKLNDWLKAVIAKASEDSNNWEGQISPLSNTLAS